MHVLPYASFVTNNIFLLLMFTVTHFVSYKRLCIIWKETAFVSTVLSELQCSGSLFWIFFYHRAKENVKYFFSAWFSDHGLLVKMISNERPFKWYINFPSYQLLRHNILYLTRYLVFPAFWSHSILLKIGQYTKSNMIIFNSSMFGTKIFDVIVNYDFIGI